MSHENILNLTGSLAVILTIGSLFLIAQILDNGWREGGKNFLIGFLIVLAIILVFSIVFVIMFALVGFILGGLLK